MSTFKCDARHRSFLDRFRFDAERHRPKPGTQHVRRIEFSEFRGIFIPLPAAVCIDCDEPIVHVPPGLWAVRRADTVEGERAAVKV